MVRGTGVSPGEARLTFIGLTALLLATACWSTTSFELAAFGLIPVVCAVFAGLITWRLSRGDAPAATLCFLHAIAYLPGSFEACGRGYPDGLLPVTAESTQLGLLTVTSFAVLASAACYMLDRVSAPRSKHAQETELLVLVAVLLLTAASFVAALRTGFHTFYGGERVESVGGVRFELLYPGLLVLSFSLTFRRLISAPNGRLGTVVILALLAGLLALLFVLQSRRLFLAALILAAFEYVVAPADEKRRSLRRRLGTVAAMGAIAATLSLASNFWRDSVLAHGELGLSDRFDDAAQRAISADAATATDRTKSRLTYLWTDAAAWEYGRFLARDEQLADVFLGQFLRATPSLILGDKSGIRDVSCETAFQRAGLVMDLACTPMGETVTFGNPLSAPFVIFSWALTFAACSYLMARNGMSFVLGHSLLTMIALIETSSFPAISGLRDGGIVLAIVVPVVWTSQTVLKRARERFATSLEKLRHPA